LRVRALLIPGIHYTNTRPRQLGGFFKLYHALFVNGLGVAAHGQGRADGHSNTICPTPTHFVLLSAFLSSSMHDTVAFTLTE
jgi:hypothetical protein